MSPGGSDADGRDGDDGPVGGTRVDAAVHSNISVAARAHGRQRDRAAVVDKLHVREGRDADGRDGGVAPVGGAPVDGAGHSNVSVASRTHGRRRDRAAVVDE